MASEKKKVFEEKTKNYKTKDVIAGTTLKKDVPLLATNLQNPKHLEFIFNEYKKQGLIPEKFNSAEELTGYLQRRLHAEMDGIIKSDESIKGDKKFKKAFFKKRKKEILQKLVQDEAVSKLTDAQKANPEVMAQIKKMRWTGLPIKVSGDGELKFDRRYFHDKVSKRVIDYAESIEPGLGKKWAKEMRASWNAIGEKNKALKASSGISMDIGHFVPSKLDGPNVGFNAEQELSKLNRSKGSTPFTGDRALARQLGVPESWMQAFTDWHLRQQGLDPNALPKGYELKGTQVVKAVEGVSDPNAEIAKNQAKYKADQELLDVVENYKEKGIIPEETKIESLDDIKKYSSAESAVPGFEIQNGKFVKSTKPTTKGLIQNIKRGGQTIFETTVNNKKVQQAITTGSKVIEAIPAPIKKAAVVLPVLGAIGDTGVIAGTFTDNKETKQQQRINEIKGASGALGLAGFKFPPLWIPSTVMWGIGEMAQWQYNKKKARYKESYQDLYYMEAAAEGMVDAEGKPLEMFINQKVNQQIDADRKTRVGRFTK